MLAQNFKTPAALDITDSEFDTLVKVLGLLEREEIPEAMFTMKELGRPECGTPGCILGWANSISPGCLQYSVLDHKTVPLFFPGQYGAFIDGEYVSAYGATRSQAAIALRNFLTHGEPRWDEALSPA